MSSIEIYDSEGRRYRDGSPTNEQDASISDYFTSGIRLAIETGRRNTLTVFFRAAESSASRSEQFYAAYTVRNLGDIDQFADEVERLVEGQWGYKIDSSSDDMAVYRQLAQGRYTVPDDDISQTLLEEVLGQNRTATVGVSDASDAIGLVLAMESSYTSAAISTSSSGNAFSSFDLVTSIGRHSGIQPLGDTKQAWDRARSQVRNQVLNSKVESIRDDVRELSSTWGYDDETIRKEVTRRVPALSAPKSPESSGSSGGSGSLGGGSLGGGSLGGSSLGGGSTEDYKKYLGIGLIAVALIGLLALAAVYAGAGGFIGGGTNNSTNPTATETVNKAVNGTSTPAPTATESPTEAPTESPTEPPTETTQNGTKTSTENTTTTNGTANETNTSSSVAVFSPEVAGDESAGTQPAVGPDSASFTGARSAQQVSLG